MPAAESRRPDKIKRPLKVLVGFSGETDDDIGSHGKKGIDLSYTLNQP